MAKTDSLYIYTQFGFIAALIGLLYVGLLPVLLSALLVYYIVVGGARPLARFGVSQLVGRSFVVIVVSALVFLGCRSAWSSWPRSFPPVPRAWPP